MNEQDCVRCFTPENVAEKRPRTSPTLQTPCRPAKRTPLREVLNSDSAVVMPQQKFAPTAQPNYTQGQIKVLIEFVLFHSAGDKKWSKSETRRTCRYSAGKVQRSLT